jgi:hypothetical protein
MSVVHGPLAEVKFLQRGTTLKHGNHIFKIQSVPVGDINGFQFFAIIKNV